MKKFVLSLMFIAAVFCSTHAEAVNKFEQLLLGNPRLFRIMVAILFACVVIFVFLYNLLSGRQEIADFLEETAEGKKKSMAMKKEYTEKYKEYKDMPTGAIGKVSLPPATLTWLGSEQKSYDLTASRELTIGRSIENLMIVKRPSTSRVHAKIRPQKDGYVLYDLLSSAGTYVNAEKIISHTLHNGDVIGIGKENFLFKFKKSENG